MVKYYAEKAEKLLELESIRGIAALAVVLYHIPAFNESLFQINAIRNGYLMVDLFFVLSGYVIYTAYASKLKTVNDALRFQALRLGRLYPIHLLFLLFFVLIEGAKYLAASYGHVAMLNDAATTSYHHNDMIAFVRNIFLVQAIGAPSQAYTFNGVAWSISVEFYTYLIFSAVILLAYRARLIVFALIAVIASAAFVYAHHWLTNYGVDLLAQCAAGFCIGCVVAHAAQRMTTTLSSAWPTAFALTLLVFVGVKTAYSYDWLIYPLTAVLIFCVVTSRDGILRRGLRHPYLVWLGTLSYSIYMSQIAIIWPLTQFCRIVLHRPDRLASNNLWTPQLSVGEDIIFAVLTVVLVVTVSAFTYTYVEAPLRRWSRTLILGKADGRRPVRSEPVAPAPDETVHIEAAPAYYDGGKTLV